MKADAATWLPRDDVFYFGNLAGDTGDAAGEAEAVVNIRDVMTMRRAVADALSGDEAYDFNHDGVVDGADLLVTRMNGAAVLPLFDPVVVNTASVARSPASNDASVASVTRRRRAVVHGRGTYELLNRGA